ncbi:MAG: NADH:flavin oxidoreductase [Gammaproteobacteria bacterium]|nr:NADH:flavin oxidoreductase [Gammaproteobacteria bacterium]
MWRPAERIKYVAEPGRWPTREEAKQSRLFQPLALGRNGQCLLNDRTWVPAMVPWRATEDGIVTPDILDWYRRFAEGRPGAIVVEATGIRDIPSGPLLRIGHDRFLPGLRALTETVRKASGGYTRLFIQIIDFLSIRRRPKRDRYLNEFLNITEYHIDKLNISSSHSESDIRAALIEMSDQQLLEVLDEREWEALQYGARERVTDTQLAHIRELPQKLPGLFSDAAERARQAGFDGVELHYAHAYTMASFLSSLNTREDGYGGSLEGRVRLPVEVFEAVRRRVGDDYIVGCRMLTEDCLSGGMETSEAAFFASRLAAQGMDFISLSRGGKFEDAKQPKVGWAAYPYTGPSGYECMPSYYSDARGPFGRNLQPAGQVRGAIRKAGLDTPTVAVGGLHNFDQAETVLADGEGDIAGLARQALADPDWFEKVRSGLGEEVRLCLYTNYCEALDQRHRQVTCELWDRENLEEREIKMSKDGKRRLVAPRWRAKSTGSSNEAVLKTVRNS